MTEAVATPANSLLTELADELATTPQDIADLIATNTSSKYRWYPAGKHPQKVVIVLIGSKPRKTFSISKSGRLARFYPSWEPVLTRLAQEKARQGVSRMSHKHLAAGVLPDEKGI